MTKIEWTDEQWSPVVGCTAVSPGCTNCWAARQASRNLHVDHTGLARAGKWLGSPVRRLMDRLAVPLHWRKPRRIAVGLMSDLFHKDVPDEFIDMVLAVAVLGHRHTYQLLTKRAERMQEYFAELSADRARREYRLCHAAWNLGDEADCHVGNLLSGVATPAAHWPLRNVWAGVSVEDQKRADERIALLLRTTAAVRWISYEPALGPIDLPLPVGCRGCNHPGDLITTWNENGRCSVCDGTRQEPSGLHWVVVGGESGPGARPCNIKWIRSMKDQCADFGIPCFVKQVGTQPYRDVFNPNAPAYDDDRVYYALLDRKGGDPEEWPADLRVRQFPGGAL